MRMPIIRLVVALVAPLTLRCATYGVKSAVNEATYYRARYVERCVTSPVPGTPCREWFLEQTKLDTAAGEAVDALKVGGSVKMQVKALRAHLAKVRKGFGKWSTP